MTGKTILAASLLALPASMVRAQATDWSGLSSTLWSAAGNWTSGSPVAGDAVSFGVSAQTTSAVDANFSIASIDFTTGAPAYTIQVTGDDHTLELTGSGTGNASGMTQTIETTGATSAGPGGLVTNGGKLNFTGSSVANGISILNGAGQAPDANRSNGGYTSFFSTSSAGNSTITNAGGAGATGMAGGAGATFFYNSSTAGSATIINQSNTAAFDEGGGSYRAAPGRTIFEDSSTAGTADFTLQGGFANFSFDLADFSSGGSAVFRSSSSAASATFSVEGARDDFASGGLVFFRDTASAGNSNIKLQAANPAISFGAGGEVSFTGDSTAGGATITTEEGTSVRLSGTSDLGNANVTLVGNSNANNTSGSTLRFGDTSSAANATIEALGATNDGFFSGQVIFGANSTAGDATITGTDFAGINFRDNSTAGSSNISVDGGAIVTIGALGSGGGAINATGGNATITANGGSSSGEEGGVIEINETATAGNATLVANGGSNGGQGGLIEFNGDASGGTARAIVNAGATFDIRPSLSPTVTIGSIEGAGSFLLDGTLTTGGNSLTTTVSGTISGNGALAKEGSGTLTLTGANTYTGITTVTAGTLAGIGNTNSALTVQSGGAIAPGAGIGSFGSTTAVFEGGSTLSLEIDSSGPTADLLHAHGDVTINPGALLDVTDIASSPLALAAGTILPIINYSGDSLTGTFNGLPDGAEFTVGPNTFAIDYHADSATLVALTVVAGGNAFDIWASANGIPGEDFEDDFDEDGIDNGLEWILGGDPDGQDPPLVTITADESSGLTLIFGRAADSIAVTSLSVEWDTDLDTFANSIPIGTVDVGPNGNEPTVDIDAPSSDQITVNIPAANAVDGKLFARIKATLR